MALISLLCILLECGASQSIEPSFCPHMIRSWGNGIVLFPFLTAKEWKPRLWLDSEKAPFEFPAQAAEFGKDEGFTDTGHRQLPAQGNDIRLGNDQAP